MTLRAVHDTSWHPLDATPKAAPGLPMEHLLTAATCTWAQRVRGREGSTSQPCGVLFLDPPNRALFNGQGLVKVEEFDACNDKKTAWPRQHPPHARLKTYMAHPDAPTLAVPLPVPVAPYDAAMKEACGPPSGPVEGQEL